MADQLEERPSSMYSQGEVDRIIAKIDERERELLLSNITEVNDRYNGNVPEAYFLETANAHALELWEVKMLFLNMNKTPAAHIQLSYFSEDCEAITPEVQSLISIVAKHENALDEAALSYGQALVNAFGPVSKWEQAAHFTIFQKQVIREKTKAYFSEKQRMKSLPAEITDMEMLLKFQKVKRTEILDMYGEDIGLKVWLAREALRKWIRNTERKFVEKAAESAVSIRFLLFLNNIQSLLIKMILFHLLSDLIH